MLILLLTSIVFAQQNQDKPLRFELLVICYRCINAVANYELALFIAQAELAVLSRLQRIITWRSAFFFGGKAAKVSATQTCLNFATSFFRQGHLVI